MVTGDPLIIQYIIISRHENASLVLYCIGGGYNDVPRSVTKSIKSATDIQLFCIWK